MGVNLILWDYIGTRGLLGKLGSDVEIPSSLPDKCPTSCLAASRDGGLTTYRGSPVQHRLLEALVLGGEFILWLQIYALGLFKR